MFNIDQESHAVDAAAPSVYVNDALVRLYYIAAAACFLKCRPRDNWMSKMGPLKRFGSGGGGGSVGSYIKARQESR